MNRISADTILEAIEHLEDNELLRLCRWLDHRESLRRAGYAVETLKILEILDWFRKHVEEVSDHWHGTEEAADELLKIAKAFRDRHDEMKASRQRSIPKKRKSERTEYIDQQLANGRSWGEIYENLKIYHPGWITKTSDGEIVSLESLKTAFRRDKKKQQN